MNYVKTIIFFLYVSFFSVKAQTVSVITSSNASCSGPCDGVVTFSIQGATGPFSVSITNTACTTPTTSLFTTDSITVNGLCKCNESYTFNFFDKNNLLIGTQNLYIFTSPSFNCFANNSPISCIGSCNASATITAFSGYAPFTYTWSPVNLYTPVVSSLCPGSYTITIVDFNGCLSLTNLIIFNPPNPCVGIHEIEQLIDIKIFPNPVSTTINFSIENSYEDSYFQIFNLIGQSVFSGQTRTPTINVSELPPGLYYLKLKSGMQTYYSKIIKE